MIHPRIVTTTVDFHNGKPALKFRSVEVDGIPYIVAKDVCSIYDLPADADGDARSALKTHGIEFRESVIDNLGEIIGPVALITEADRATIQAAAIKRLQGGR